MTADPTTAAQEAIVRAMAEPSFYPHRPPTVEHVQTHISHVFLAGPYVYKLKKAVRFPFLDFATAERRRHFCHEEVRLNRRLSPAVYLDVVPITRASDGRYVLGGRGEAVEHVVQMRRLPQDGMLVSMMARGELKPEMLEALARMLAQFHATAPTGPEIAAHAAPGALEASWDENMRTLAPFVGGTLAPEEHEILSDFGPHFIRTHETLLRGRLERGHVREGHGDLHGEHVCFVDAAAAERAGDPPLAPGLYVFDCIEFSPPFRCNDVASEIAFLAMDLEHREHSDLAATFVEAYAAAAADPMVHVLLPFYASFRACVRAKVECLTSAESEIDVEARAAAAAHARQYLALAVRHAWRTGGPAVIACTGLSATGKSTLAAALAAATDFVVLRSDILRRQSAATRSEPAFGEAPGPAAYASGRYTGPARAAVYEALYAEADAALASERGVIVDATFIRRADRNRLAAMARRRRRPYVFVECRADEACIRARLEARTVESVSDARWDTYLAQREQREPLGADEPHIVVDTGAGLEAARAEALRRLWQWRQGRPLTP